MVIYCDHLTFERVASAVVSDEVMLHDDDVWDDVMSLKRIPGLALTNAAYYSPV